MWDLKVGSDLWALDVVSDERRARFFFMSSKMIKRGDTFIVISTHDPGPAKFPTLPDRYDSMGRYDDETPEEKVWHIVLLDDVLVWIDEGSFLSAAILLSEE